MNFLLILMSIISLNREISFTITYNNIPHDTALKTSWGMSCYIEGFEKNILFDTGGDGEILLYNMKKLDIEPDSIDIIVLSHIHGDHTEGIWELLKINPAVTVYLPSSFPKGFKHKVTSTGAKIIEVSKPSKICKDVWTTGEMGRFIKEQALVLDTKKGTVVVTGCAHPGIVNIVKKAEEMMHRDKTYLALGGFHLMAYRVSGIKEIIKGLKNCKVEKIGPSHCTGGEAIELFRKAWGDDFIDMGCGRRVFIK